MRRAKDAGKLKVAGDKDKADKPGKYPKKDECNAKLAAVTATTKGDQAAAEELLPLVYDELRRLAQSHLSREAPGHTLQPTALVHEAYLRLVGTEGQRFENRAHFFGAAAEAMRRILIDRARQKARVRHGGGLERVLRRLPEEG